MCMSSYPGHMYICVAVSMCGVPMLISETVVHQFTTSFNEVRFLNQTQISLIDMTSLASQPALRTPITAFLGQNYRTAPKFVQHVGGF